MWLALIVAALIAPDPLPFHSRARVTGDVVRLGDVADLTALPEALRARAASTPVARLISPRQTLSSRRVAERARAAVPGLSAWLPSGNDRPIEVRADLAAPAPPPPMPIAPPPEPDVRPGDALTIRVMIGPVAIEREVHALQAGRRGRPLFVRTAEGRVLSAPLADDE